MNLSEVIRKRLPIDIYLKGKFYDTFYYVKERDIYQGEFGFLDMDAITKVLLKKEEVNHITIKVHNEQ
jgi:hypothetical protein